MHSRGAEHSNKRDEGRFGVGYFEPDNCDHSKIACNFTAYPEYANLKVAYTTTANSTVNMTTYSPKRSRILKCPKNMDTNKLQPTPVVNYLTCSVRQPMCGGAKANAFEKDASLVVPMGTKKKPSNSASRAKKKEPAAEVSTSTTSAAPGSSSRSAAAAISALASLVAALWFVV